MNLEQLLNERDSLRNEIEQKRKRNEKTLLYIKEFFEKIVEYVNFCRKNDINTCVWHEFDNNKYLITCNENLFSIHLYDDKFSDKKGFWYVLYEGKKIYSTIGVIQMPELITLEEITNEDGNLSENAKWFEKNIEMILNLVEEDFKECVNQQIKEAKEILGW